VETLFPLEDPAIVAQAIDLLQVYLRDTVRARELQPDGRYHRVAPAPDQPPVDSQAHFMQERASWKD
jgi:polyphosphate kinase